jgi:hypothetical protein
MAMLLNGCASIPLSTAVRFSSMSAKSLAQIDPVQVRVKLSVPVGYEINVAESELKFSLVSSSGESHAGAMGLSLLQSMRDIRSGGFFSQDITVTTYFLALSPEGTRQLRELQQFVLSGQPRKFEFSVKAPFAKLPPGAQEVTFWADLKLSQHDSFVPLIDGAKIRYTKPSAGS